MNQLHEMQMTIFRTQEKERFEVQKKTYTAWINLLLVNENMEVKNLFVDLADGQKLLKLLEIRFGVVLPKANNGTERKHKIENVNKCLALLTSKSGGIRAEDIVDGNPTLILTLISIIFQMESQEIEANMSKLKKVKLAKKMAEERQKDAGEDMHILMRTAFACRRTRAHVNLTDDFGRTSLMRAAMKGDLNELKSSLNYGADVHATDKNGETALKLASVYGHFNIVKALIIHEANDNEMNVNSISSLFKAAFCGDLKNLKLFLNRGADVNLHDIAGNTTLQIASYEGRSDIVKILINHKANVNLSNDDGRTPLMSAAEQGHLETLTLLLNHGAEVNVIDLYGETAIKKASAKKYSDIVKILLDHKADGNLTKRNCGKTLRRQQGTILKKH